MKIRWSAEARKDLRAIKRFIGRDSELYAAQMIARIIAMVEKTAQHPSRGHPVHEYPEELLKETHESPYRIIYSVENDTLEVVTIVNFKQRLSLKR